MQKYKLNNYGFHVLPLILIVLVVGLVGFVGIRVFHLQTHSVTDGQAVGQVANSKSSLQTAPVGWKVFADTSMGVQFIYPAVYGSFKEKTDFCCGSTFANYPEYTNMLTSDRLSANYLPGVAGAYSLNTYKKGVMEFQPQKFGPKLKLVGNEWIVTKPSENGIATYEKGATYPEMARINLHGLEVYSAETGYEGIMSYSLYFVTKGRLRVLELPPFDSEQYSTTYNINDRAPYDAMFAQVRDSIRHY